MGNQGHSFACLTSFSRDVRTEVIENPLFEIGQHKEIKQNFIVKIVVTLTVKTYSCGRRKLNWNQCHHLPFTRFPFMAVTVVVKHYNHTGVAYSTTCGRMAHDDPPPSQPIHCKTNVDLVHIVYLPQSVN